MAVYAIKVEQVLADTYLVKADSLEEAIDKVSTYANEKGFDLEYVDEVNYKPSPCAKANGVATKEQLEDLEWLEEV